MRILHAGLCVSPQPYNGLQRAFIRHSNAYAEINCGELDFNTKLIQLATSFKPDIIFLQIQAENIIQENTVVELKKLGTWIVNWTGDVRHPISEWYFKIGKLVDVTMFTNMNDVYEFQRKGLNAAYLEIGIDETIFTHIGRKNPTKPIVFLGNNYGKDYFPLSEARIKMVEHLKEKFPNDFAVYGNGWNNGDGNFNHSQFEEAALYRGAKIALSISHFHYEKYTSDRLLRIMATGTPLCLAQWYPQMPFEDKAHLRTWHTLEDLEELCKYYLAKENEIERMNIAINGQFEIEKNFTFDCMIRNLINFYKHTRNVTA